MYGYVVAGLAVPAVYAGWLIYRHHVAGPASQWAFFTAMLVMALQAAMATPDGPSLLASFALGWALVVLAAIDLRIHRLPDLITLPLILAGLAQSALTQPDRLTQRAIGAVIGYGLLAGVATLYRRVRRRDGLGLGDAKLLAAAGAWLGWERLPEVILIGSACGLAWAWSRRHRADAALAFGPWLALGTWICWLAMSSA